MTDASTDFDGLIDRVRDDDDHRALEEAILCAQAGATRLAYVGVWLAIAGSIRGKLREMGRRDADCRV